MSTTDLGELIRAECAQRVKEGRSPTRAQLAWLQAVPERDPQSSVDISRNARGEMQFSVKVYHANPTEAKKIALDIADNLRTVFPMADGTVGSPMKAVK
jgi:hypothetical protein